MPGDGRCGIIPGLGRGPPGPAAGRGPPAPGAGRGPPGPGRAPGAPGAGRGPPGPGRGPAAAGRGAPGTAPPAGAGRGALLKGLLPGRGAGRGPGRGPAAAPGRGAAGAAPPAGPGREPPAAGAGACGAGGADGAAAAGACGAGAAGRGPGAAGRAGAGAAASAAGGTGATGAGAGAEGAGAGLDAGAAARGAGRAAGAAEPLPEPVAPSASRSRRATGASTVEDADFTNSPCSLSLASTVLLSTPNSLASSCTRALPGTGLLLVRPAACPLDLVVSGAWSSWELHGWLIRRRPALDVRPGRVPDRLGIAVCRTWSLVHPVPRTGHRGGCAENVVPERTGLQGGTAAQCPGEGPASLRCMQALRCGVHGGSPAGEPTPWIGDQGPVTRDDTQQLGDRSAVPATHTGAHRDRRFGHPAL
jgi:hypothetical protein